MACFWLHSNETTIKIPNTCEQDSVTFYNIEVKVGDVKWSIRRRYNDFFELHQQLVNDHGVSKDLLPPKKAIMNKSKAFIEGRREALETYLRNVLHYLKRTMPKEFWEFLDLHEYDIYFLLQNLAAIFCKESFKAVTDLSSYTFNPLQLHAISECLKRPVLEIERVDKVYDLSNVLDFCSQLCHMTVRGSDVCYKESSIIPNSLIFELSSFKALKTLSVFEANLDNIYSVDNLRSTLKKFEVHNTSVTNISKILQCDSVHKTIIDKKQSWTNLEEVDFSDNVIDEVDDTIQLAPHLTVLTMNQNKLTNFPNLSCLTNLKQLYIAQNLISVCENLHTKLGNVVAIDLSQNYLSSLKGFSKLYSLEYLNVSCNKICYIEDVKFIGDLPCLEHIILTGNPVATTVDYRIRVLEHFGDRAKELCLDNEKPSQQELDKASVLRALKIAKDGKSRTSKTEN